MASPLFSFGTQTKEMPGFKSQFPASSPVHAAASAMQNSELITDMEFNELRDFIYNESGIYFTESKKYLLEGRVKKRVVANSLRTIGDYLKLIKSPLGRREVSALMDIVTINETYFFRAEQQLEAVEKEIVREILSGRGGINQIFNIWSAASSTGEEAYSLAIIINERIKPQFPHIHFRIIGSDINKEVIEAAKKGIYGEYAVKHLPPMYLKKYFSLIDGRYHLSNEIKRMVSFVQLNLFDERAVKTMNYFDIIFCANVLIYFDTKSKEKVVSMLYDSLNKGGYFFIGCSESLHGITKAFRLVHFHNAMAYKKE